jgi:hypothetical protein
MTPSPVCLSVMSAVLGGGGAGGGKIITQNLKKAKLDFVVKIFKMGSRIFRG